MPINGQDLYRLASEIYQQVDARKPDEVLLRTAINRAYYGAFLAARDHASLQKTGADSHKVVRDYYEGRGIDGYKVFQQLMDLCSSRTKADYDTGGTSASRDVQKALKQSASILQLLTRL